MPTLRGVKRHSRKSPYQDRSDSGINQAQLLHLTDVLANNDSRSVGVHRRLDDEEDWLKCCRELYAEK